MIKKEKKRSIFFFFKQKTAYEIYQCDWSSDVCSSDLEKKEITLFTDGDRGGKLIAQNVVDNVKIAYIATAPDGKEVEELTGKEIFIALRKKVPVNKFSLNKHHKEEDTKKFELSEEDKEKLKKLSDENEGTEKAILLDESLNDVKKVSVKSLNSTLKRSKERVPVIIIDGTVTSSTIQAAEEAKVSIIVAKNFATTDTKIQLLSF